MNWRGNVHCETPETYYGHFSSPKEIEFREQEIEVAANFSSRWRMRSANSTTTPNVSRLAKGEKFFFCLNNTPRIPIWPRCKRSSIFRPLDWHEGWLNALPFLRDDQKERIESCAHGNLSNGNGICRLLASSGGWDVPRREFACFPYFGRSTPSVGRSGAGGKSIDGRTV